MEGSTSFDLCVVGDSTLWEKTWLVVAGVGGDWWPWPRGRWIFVIIIDAITQIIEGLNESNSSMLWLTVFYFQVVAKHTQCNHCRSELLKTLLDSCIDQHIETRDLNCGLATSRYMVENFLIFLVTESGYFFFVCFGVFVLQTLIYLWYECFVFVIWVLTGRLCF